MDFKKRYKKSTTHIKYADTLIKLGEKFYFTAFTIPIAMILKPTPSLYSYLFITIALAILGLIGLKFQRHGLKIYDEADNE